MKQIELYTLLILSMLSFIVLLGGKVTFAENIDPNNDDSQYAYGENIGWLNAEPLGDGKDGVVVEETKLTGYIWAENIGWVSLSCENTSSCVTVDYGVINDGGGNLSGYAWSENVGWISFSCDNTVTCSSVDYGVTIDPVTGKFNGHAWGENIGWIRFHSAGPVPFSMTTSWPEKTPVDMDLPANWSMISLPIDPIEKRLNRLFSEAKVIYGYEKGKGYVRVQGEDNMEIGKGYWMLLDQNHTFNLLGQPIESYNLPVYEDGWAMIGGCSSSAQVSSSNCTIRAIYGFVQGVGYQRIHASENLESGKGYWILFKDVTANANLTVQGFIQ